MAPAFLTACVLCALLGPSLVIATASSDFDMETYNVTLESIPLKSSCFVKTAISSFCWQCNGSVAVRSRYLYRSRCVRAYGSASSVRLLPCPHTKKKNFCYMTCDTLGQKSCCSNHYGPLCLSCPKDRPFGTRRTKSVCSSRGSCRSGVSGNGFCSCGYRFRGNACQRCRPGYYGMYCQYRCNCRHGYCEGRTSRSCICKSGWTGLYCSRRVSSCKDCGANERCTSSGKCVCKDGFAGKNCTEKELCTATSCSSLANCTTIYSSSEGRRKISCKCWPGFTGDGHHCLVLNPCKKIRCRSHEVCLVINRGMPNCICNQGYERNNGTCVKKKCTRPDLCPKNAVCKWASAYLHDQKCDCKKGYYSSNCIPSLGTIIKELKSNPRYRERTASLSVFPGLNLEPNLVRISKRLTVLLPVKVTSSSDFFRSAGVNRHIILAYVNATNTTFWNLYGDKLHFTFFNTTANGNVSEPIGEIECGNSTVNILQRRDFSNGVAYMIEEEILNTLDRFYSPKQTYTNLTKFLETVSVPMAHLYHSWLKKKNRAPRNYRLLVFPLKGFTKHEIEYLKSNDSVASYKLKYYLESTVKELRYWRYMEPILSFNRNTKYKRFRNQRQFKFTKEGRWYVSGSLVVANFVRVGRYLVLLVDRPLVSSIVTPILPGQCHQKQTVTLKVRYSSRCPAGTKLVRRVRWVQAICQREIIITRQCCPGFFGPACEFHCPGPYGVPCYNNGKCFDGLKGNGQCYCKDPFSGLECEKCATDDTFGPYCNETCPCRRGKCDGGTIFATGKCLTCEKGYSGDYCDKKIIRCFNTTLECGLNQHCESDDVSAPRCVCDQGYRRNRTGCYPHNPCLDPNRDFGGCQGYSICKYLGPGNSTCVCRPGWTGDGTVCEKQWSMCKTASDCKINGSVCVRGACRCGNGLPAVNGSCERRFDCSKNNGGCHPAAVCYSSAPDFNSHCKCREGDQGDGFVCLESWLSALRTHNVLPGIAFSTMTKVYYRLYVRMMRRKLGPQVPLTIFFTPRLGRFRHVMLYKTMNHLVLKGLYFIEGPGENFLFTKFFLNETPWKVQAWKKGNGTFIQDARVVKENIFVREGLLHVLDKPLRTTPYAVKLFSNVTSPSPDNTSPPGPWLAYPRDHRNKDSCASFSKPVQILMSIVRNTATPNYAFRSVSKAIRRLLFIHGNHRWFGVSYSHDKGMHLRLIQIMSFCLAEAEKVPKVPGCYVPFYSDLREPLCPKGFKARQIFHNFAIPPNFTVAFTVRKSQLPFTPHFRHSLSGDRKLNLTQVVLCCSEPLKPGAPNPRFTFDGSSFNLIRNGACPNAPGRLHTQKNYQPYDVFDIITPPYFAQVKYPKRDILTVCHYFNWSSGGRPNTTKITPLPTPSSPPVKLRIGLVVPPKSSCQGEILRLPQRSKFRLSYIMGKTNPDPRLCAPSDKFQWPAGTYCALANSMVGSCPEPLPKRFLLEPTRLYLKLCCGTIPGNATEAKNLPSSFLLFTIYSSSSMPTNVDQVCPTIAGHHKYGRANHPWSRRYRPSGLKLPPKVIYYCYYWRAYIAGYSLPQPETGCNPGLQTGFLVQRLEKTDTRMPNRFLHLSGMISPNKHIIRLEFCSTRYNPKKPIQFPKGHYCVYRRGGKCMDGFKSSSAEIDDEDDLGPVTAMNRSGGAIPDGIWGYNFSTSTRYYFCCREDGQLSEPMVLPFTKPFYLFRGPNADKCQPVRGFTARHEVLKLDAEDSRKLGQPSVKIKGLVPLSRSSTRGADIDVHYCYYDNRTPKDKEAVLGFLQAGSSPCPDGFAAERTESAGCKIELFVGSKLFCPTAHLNVCYAKNSSFHWDDGYWPKGAYCLFGKADRVCHREFYTINVKTFSGSADRICCRDDGPALPKPLQFPVGFKNNFGLFTANSACPPVDGMVLVQQLDTFPGFKDCFYSSWPNNTDFALPAVGKECPFGFESGLLGPRFLPNSPVASEFESSFGQKNGFFLDNMRICSSKAKPGQKNTKKWPRGAYCVFSDDPRVAMEFPFAVTFFKNAMGKGLITASFIFCKNDTSGASNRGVNALHTLPWPHFAVIVPDFCPRSTPTGLTLSREVLLRGPGKNKDWRIGRVNGSQSVDSKKQTFTTSQLVMCVFSRKKSADKTLFVRFAPANELIAARSCSICSAQVASCSTARLCTCAKQLIGDGQVCESNQCGANAVSMRASTYFRRRCQCREGFHGDGLTCVRVDQKLLHGAPSSKPWPSGPYAFVRSFENIEACPPGFREYTSPIVGHTESFAFSVSAPLAFCVRMLGVIQPAKSSPLPAKEPASDWPEGNFCVWAWDQRSCPTGFKTSYVASFFRSFPTAIPKERLPSRIVVTDQGDTLISFSFCCRSSSPSPGPPKTISDLPTTTFFSLLRQGGVCPDVARMNLIEHRLLLFRTAHGNRSKPDLPKTPDLTFDPKLGSVEVHVCNYHMTPEAAASFCHNCETPMSLYKSNETLYSVIKSDPILSVIKATLEKCGLWKKIEHVHHIYVAIFFMGSLESEEQSPAVDCDIVKRFIVFSNKQMSLILGSMTNKTMFRSFANDLATLEVVTSKFVNEYFINGIGFYQPPYVIAKNGVVYMLKKQYFVKFTKRAVSHSWVTGLVITLLLVACVCGILGFLFVRRRRGMSSMMSFVNPVYYRPVES